MGGTLPHKAEDLDLICTTRNSALACVLFVDSNSNHVRGQTAFAWWVSSGRVKALAEGGFFLPAESTGVLALWIRYVEAVPGAGSKQNTYITLPKQNRQDGAQPGDRSSGELVEEACFDFGRLPAAFDGG